MKILALDLATHCGWAHSLGSSGMWPLDIKKDESDGIRLIKFTAQMRWVKKVLGIDLVVYEAARHGGMANRGLVTHSELQGIVKQLSKELEYQYKGYSPRTIKKFATGSGKATKEVMIKAANRIFPNKSVEDDNEADALCLLSLAMHEFP